MVASEGQTMVGLIAASVRHDHETSLILWAVAYHLGLGKHR